MIYLIVFGATFLLSVLMTVIIRKLAIYLNIVDLPNSDRKIHSQPIPLLGGVAIFFSFVLILAAFTFGSKYILGGFIDLKNIIGILIAGLIIIIGGVLDDKFNLNPKIQIVFPALASIIIVAAGIGIPSIRNPFGGLISFNNWQYINNICRFFYFYLADGHDVHDQAFGWFRRLGFRRNRYRQFNYLRRGLEYKS
jgi:UDP-GlcNAc:undecaprenyl-phosphate GlcNAc-1-phosphate transferase